MIFLTPFGPDTCFRKCKDDEMMFEAMQTFERGKFRL